MSDSEAGGPGADSPPKLPPQVFLVAVLMVLFGVGDRISFKLSVDCVSNYVFFLNQLTMLVYVVAFFVPVVAAGQLCGPWASRKYLLKYAVMGCLDGICTLVVVLSAPYVPGPLQIVFMQGVVPTTMIASYFLLRKRYSWSHVAGAATILGGIVLSALHSGQSDSKKGSHVLWYLLFLSFNIPASLSSVYKESVFRAADTELPLNVVNFWVSCWQFVITIAYSPLVVPIQNLTWGQLPTNFGKGAACVFAHHDGGLSDTCTWYSTVTIVVFFVCTVSWNYACLYLIKNGSALLMFVSSTASIPLASLGFAVPFIVRGSCTPRANVTWEVCVAVVVVIVGLVLYNRVPETMAEDKVEARDKEARRPLLINESITNDETYSGFGNM